MSREQPNFEKLFLPEFTGADIQDLRRLNWLAKADHKKKDFCYRLKDILLEKYSTFDGFDLQEFTRPCWQDDEYGTYGDAYYAGETYSWHEHILERRRIGEAVFHRPTEHFRYSDIKDHKKQSPRFVQMLAVCRTGKIEEILALPCDFDQHSGIEALRRLVHKFKKVLRSEIEKPPRAKYPFLKVKRYHSGEFDEFRVRVPSSVAVCSGCGAKLVTTVSNWSLLKIKLGIFTGLRFVTCDSHYNYSQHGFLKFDCPESRKQFRSENGFSGEREPGWITEKETISSWAREFFSEHLDEFTAELGLADWFEKNAHEFAEEIRFKL
jgi:hypothetical protein